MAKIKPKNEVCSPVEHIILSKIDIMNGKLTFGQRIELGEIFQNDTTSEAQKFEQTFIRLHEYKPEPSEYALLLDYFGEIIHGITYWIEKEQTLLKYEPTSEEVAAGIKEFSSKVGEFGTIKALAKAYSKDPDEILEWDYGKIFGILFTDLEEHKFQKAYNKVIEQKSKHGR